MNIETNRPPDISAMIPADKKEGILKLAAVGLTATQIAAAVEFPPAVAAAFIALADVPGSIVARLIEEGHANGIATPQMKLQEAAAAGNIDAIKTLRGIQRENRFNEFIFYMDDDEFTG